LLGFGVVSADEHVWRAAWELGIDKVSIADYVEGFDDSRLWQPSLNLLPRWVSEPQATDGGVLGRKTRGLVASMTTLPVRFFGLASFDGILSA